MSPKTALIHARIEPSLKEAAEKILDELGMTATEAIRMLYAQIARKKGIPFNLDLETEDTPEHYTKVKNDEHLKELIGMAHV